MLSCSSAYSLIQVSTALRAILIDSETILKKSIRTGKKTIGTELAI